MPLIEPVSNLSIKRSVNLYTLILFISFGALLYWLATDRYQFFVDSHENTANSTTKIVAFQINKILKEQKRVVGIFAEDTRTLLSRLSDNPNNVTIKNRLIERLRKYQPDFVRFNILSKSGTPIIENLNSDNDKICLEDVKKNIQNKIHNISLHPDDGDYHYDITSTFSTNGTKRLFFVSFNVDEITDLLNSTQSEKHSLILVNTGPNNSVGIDSQGNVKKVSGSMNFQIHNGADLNALAKMQIKDTNWYVVDMIDVEFFNGYREKIMTEFFIAFYIFAMIALFMRHILLKQDAKRSLSEEQLKQNHEQIKILNNSLDQLSKKDSLTNLYNRRYFDEMAQHEWNRSIRTQNPLTCILLDIDHFKKYNDHYGHQAGDKCIKDISDLLRQSFKRSGDIVARYGGEEFIIIMPDSSEEEAKVAIIKFQIALKKLCIPHKASDTDQHVTISAGIIVQVPSTNSTIESFVKKADKALYLAKKAGRNQWIMHKEEKISHWARRM